MEENHVTFANWFITSEALAAITGGFVGAIVAGLIQFFLQLWQFQKASKIRRTHELGLHRSGVMSVFACLGEIQNSYRSKVELQKYAEAQVEYIDKIDPFDSLPVAIVASASDREMRKPQDEDYRFFIDSEHLDIFVRARSKIKEFSDLINMLDKKYENQNRAQETFNDTLSEYQSGGMAARNFEKIRVVAAQRALEFRNYNLEIEEMLNKRIKSVSLLMDDISRIAESDLNFSTEGVNFGDEEEDIRCST